MSNIHISLAAEKLFDIVGWQFTNSQVLSLAVSAFIILIALTVRLTVSLKPRGFYNAVEAIFEGLLDLIEQVTGDRKKTQEFFPLLATIFLFIILNNYAGLLPGVGSITYNGQPLLRSANADLNTTLALAVVAVAAIQYFGIKHLGVFAHMGKYFTIKGFPVMSFVGLLEFVSEFAKMVSFSFRLFGNIFAGEVLLMVVGVIAPVLAPLPFYGLELFVGAIQALVFFMLTLVFLNIAAAEGN